MSGGKIPFLLPHERNLPPSLPSYSFCFSARRKTKTTHTARNEGFFLHLWPPLWGLLRWNVSHKDRLCLSRLQRMNLSTERSNSKHYSKKETEWCAGRDLHLSLFRSRSIHNSYYSTFITRSRKELIEESFHHESTSIHFL